MKYIKAGLAVLMAVLLAAGTAILPQAVSASSDVQARLLGDADNDRKVTVLDVTVIQKALASLITLDGDAKKAADADGDSVTTVLDATFIQKWLASIKTPYAIGKPMENHQTDETEAVRTEPPTETQEESQDPAPPTETQDPSGYTPNDFEREVVRLTNEVRAEQGLSALTLDAGLCYVAHLKAQDMCENNYFDHTSPTYGDAFEMMAAFGISYMRAGENIAAGQSTPQRVVDRWMDSPGHRANILREGFTAIGVGCYEGKGAFRIYWSQMFIG